MSLITRYLAEAQLAGDVAEFHRDNLDVDAIVGRVHGHRGDVLRIDQVSEHGDYAGLTFVSLGDITRIRSRGRELSFLSSVAPPTQEWSQRDLLGGSLPEVAANVSEQFGYVTLYIEDARDDVVFIGEIIERDADHLRLLEYGTISTQDRRDFLLRDDEITRVEVDGPYERRLRNMPGELVRPLDRSIG